MPNSRVTLSDIETYERDGVVCMRNVIDAESIRALRIGFERNLTHPSDRASIFYGDAAAFIGVRDAETRGRFTGRQDLQVAPRFASDIDTWRRHPEFEAFVFRSSVAALAGRLMQSRKV